MEFNKSFNEFLKINSHLEYLENTLRLKDYFTIILEPKISLLNFLLSQLEISRENR